MSATVCECGKQKRGAKPDFKGAARCDRGGGTVLVEHCGSSQACTASKYYCVACNPFLGSVVCVC